MDNSYASEATVFLLQTVFGLFLMLVMLRLLLQWVRADFYNPLCAFVVKTTSWALKPLRRVIPGFGGIDIASIVLLFVVQLLALFLIGMAHGIGIPVAGLLVQSIAALIKLLFTVYMITIIAQAILSWVGPGTYNPLTSLLYTINEPVLRPTRRLIPVISGIDFSPLILLIVIQLLMIIVVRPISDISITLGYPAFLL